MRRKLIDYEIFNKISEESLSKAEAELIGAENILSEALNADELKLYCFNEDTAVYETLDRSYIHTSYNMNNNSVIFENIEELVIDEESAKKESHNILSKMVDSLLNDDAHNAENAFNEYIGLPTTRRDLMEGTKATFWVEKPDKPKKKRGPQSPDVVAKRKEAKRRSEALRTPTEKEAAKREKEKLKAIYGPKARIHTRFEKDKPGVKKIKSPSKRKMNEWSVLSENVLGYVKHQEYGPIFNHSEFKKDDRGNIVAMRIPNSHARNEGKILNFNWKTLNTEVQVLRGKAFKSVLEDVGLARALAELRKCNAVSDNSALQETLENIVAKWPNLIYLTQSELAKGIGQALDTVGESNYDDQMCEFMAEGILMTATEAYEDRVNRIIRIAGAQPCKDCENKYEYFQDITNRFYPSLDENTHLEMQVFVDLYNALADVHKLAHGDGNEMLRAEANTYLRELKDVIEHQAEPTLELAGEVASWLMDLVETNLETKDWSVSNTPHITVSGDHPQMAKNAAKGYTPSSDFSGDWGDPAPVSDGKNYKGGLADEMRSDSWGNWSNQDVYPALSNPYVPKPFGTYTMNDPDGADKSGENDWSRYQSDSTWPRLQNPNSPSAETPYTYKMNHGKEPDLVVDK